MKKNIFKQERGITLIALIITIIILVILAAVSIRAVYNMGIVGHAINGTQQYAERSKEENAMLDETGRRIEDAVSKVKEIQEGKKEENLEPGLYKTNGTFIPWATLITEGPIKEENGVLMATEYGTDAETGYYDSNSNGDNLEGKLVIDNTITSIDDGALGSTNLEEVIIPDSLTKIGNNAFKWSNYLTKVNIPSSVTSIGDTAFFNTGITGSVVIPNSILTMGHAVFANCNINSINVIGYESKPDGWLDSWNASQSWTGWGEEYKKHNVIWNYTGE